MTQIWVRRFVILISLCGLALAADDTAVVVDAKRKVAHELLRDYKYKEAAAMLEEITRSPSADYRDYQSLAVAYDKLARPTDALAAYNKVIELLPTPATRDEKLAKSDAERRTKASNQMTDKINLAVADFMKKITAMEREATVVNDPAALDELFRLRGSLYRSSQDPDFSYCEVMPKPGGQNSGIRVTAGQKIRVVARGKWRLGEAGHAECGPDGFKDKLSGPFPLGALIGYIDTSAEKQFPLGHDGSMTAPTTGNLSFFMEEYPDNLKQDASGTIYVIVHREAR